MKLEFKNLIKLDISTQHNVLEWRNAKQVSNYFILPKIEINTHINWLKSLREHPEKQVAFVIYYDEKPIGLTYFRNIDHLKSCDWGVFIHSIEHRGKGIGLKTLEFSLDYAFNVLNLNKINLEVLENNEKAIELYKKCGFVIQNNDNKRKKIINDLEINVLYMTLDKT